MKRLFSSYRRLLAMLSLGLVGLLLLTDCKKANSPAAPTTIAAQWYCPMHPSYVSDKPGECPICHMTLVPKNMAPPEEENKAASPSKGKVLYYRSPMNPAQTSPVPRKDEMGMDYVPIYEDSQAPKEGPTGYASVTLTPEHRALDPANSF
jgi:hypothetical protein